MTGAASLPVLIDLTNGHATIIDAEDAERVLAHRWYAFVRKSGYVEAQASIERDGRETVVSLHRFIAGEPDGLDVDHRNRDTLDNRRANLRECTRSQNLANRRGWSASGLKGVRRRRDRWQARIKVNRREIVLGQFGTAEDAARAYDAAAREIFGEFALPNFPNE